MPADKFDPNNLSNQIRALETIINRLGGIYTRSVIRGYMTRGTADFELACLAQILLTLKNLEKGKNHGE
jgi:hypothetical protein